MTTHKPPAAETVYLELKKIYQERFESMELDRVWDTVLHGMYTRFRLPSTAATQGEYLAQMVQVLDEDYIQSLKNLPAEALKKAALRCFSQHKTTRWPTPADIRHHLPSDAGASVSTQTGEVQDVLLRSCTTELDRARVRHWLAGAVFDGQTLRCISPFCADFVRNNMLDMVQGVFGKEVFIACR